VELPRPEVTIVDPSAPTTPADVLTGGREPWRPTRRQARLAAVVTVAVAALGITGWLVADLLRDRAADRALVRAMAFTVSETDTALFLSSDLAPTLEILSRTPGSVRILDVRVDAPGFPVLAVDEPVGHFGNVTVPLDREASCSPALYTATVTHLLVRAATPRGAIATLKVALSDGVGEAAAYRARMHCGYLTPEEGLALDLSRAVLRDGVLTLTYRVSNQATLPVVVDGVRAAAEGLVASLASAARTIPAGGGPGQAPGEGSLVVRVRVSDCAALRAGLAAAGSGDGLDGPQSLRLAVHHAYGTADLYVSGEQITVQGHDDFSSVDHLGRLIRTCSPDY
jgi:hypothetical protein